MYIPRASEDAAVKQITLLDVVQVRPKTALFRGMEVGLHIHV